MKNTIIAALMLLTMSATAQTITSDTTFFTVQNGTLFQTTRTTYDNGGYFETSNPTDTMRVANIAAAKIRGRAEEVNKAYRTLYDNRSMFFQVIKQDAEITQGIGISPLNLVRQSADVFSDTLATWAFESGTAQTPCTFTVTNAGVLRIKIGNDANRNMVLLGTVLRINNLPASGSNVTFYRINERLWVNLDNTQRLVRTSLRRLPQTNGF
jgi:hypothetical protein